MLCTYAQELRAGFFPYVGDVANVMGGLVGFEYNEDVQIAAGQTLPELVRCAALALEARTAGATGELVQQLLQFCLEKLTQQLAEEPDTAVRSPSRPRTALLLLLLCCSARPAEADKAGPDAAQAMLTGADCVPRRHWLPLAAPAPSHPLSSGSATHPLPFPFHAPPRQVLAALTEVLSNLVELSVEHDSTRLSQAQLQTVCECLAELMSESFDRRAEHEQTAAANRTGDEDEDDDDDGVPEEEESLLATIVECVGQGLKAYHSAFLQLCGTRILPYVQTLLGPERSASDRTAAICVFDDIIE